MNTKKCKYCQEDIAKNAKKCPKCGGKLGMPTWAKFLIIVFIIFICIVGCVGSCTNAVNEAIDETSNSYKDKNGKTSFKINETFENKYEKITMLEVNTNFTDYSEYVGPSDGNKVIMAKFEIENINTENDVLYASSLSFNAYADKTNVDRFYGASSKYSDFSATVGQGKKTIGYVFYEVPINAQSIVIEYEADFWTDGNVIEFMVQ